MKITILSVGKLKEKYLKDGVAEYAKRLSRFTQIEIIEVDDEKVQECLSKKEEEQIKKKECEKLSKRTKEGAVKIVLDISGVSLDSENFASKLSSFFLCGKSHIEFIIGGSLGLPSQFVNAADLRLSLSKMTFPHQLARLLLIEQIYRAFKIMNNETYHK